MMKNKVNLDEIFKGEKVTLLDNKFINWSNGKAGIGLELIGVKEGKLVFVGLSDWQIYEIEYIDVKCKGKLLGGTLADVREKPEILLSDAKYMTVEEIEKALGHKVIVKEEKW